MTKMVRGPEPRRAYFKMRNLRTITLGVAALVLSAAALAQFDGPAPIAWRWLQPTSTPPAGSPLVSGDTIYTAVGQRVFALDKNTGNLKWRFPLVDPIDGAFRSAPFLVGDVLVAAGDNKTIYGIDPLTGASKWTYLAPNSIIGQPVHVGNYVVFATSDDKLMAVNPANGQPGWESQYNVFDGITGFLGGVENRILVFTRSNTLFALDVNSKKTLWTQRFGQLPAGAKPVVFEGTIYTVSGPYLVALNSITGNPKWQVGTGQQLATAPGVSSEGVVALTQDGQALFYDLNGRPRTHDVKVENRTTRSNVVELGSFPLVQPTPVGNKYIIPTTNGAINLVDPSTGEVQWSFLVRPIGTPAVPNAPGGGGGDLGAGPGGGPGGPGGPGGLGGPGGPGGLGGGQGSGTQSVQPVLAVQASGPAVVAGNTLLVPARDGSILAFDKEQGVDLTAPMVKLLWPSQGDYIGRAPQMFLFDIQDEASGVNSKTLKIEIDGKVLEHTFGRDNMAQVATSRFGPNMPLSDGRKTVVVTVSDWMGNETRKEFSFVVDNTLVTPPPSRPSDSGGPGGPGGPGKGGGAGGGIGG